MADKVILNNISDDAQSKQFISDVLMPRVFHNIPMNTLNTGAFSIINEYMSQAMEQMGFTSAFYFNESFITKAVLPDSIYSEAAIFNIGYTYATPSATNILLELKLEDIYRNARYNSVNNLYEFILDKNTKFNLSNGNVYSLDYDILIQYMNIPTSDNTTNIPAWNVQYMVDDDMNSIAINKDRYIMYRVTDTWLCLFIKASEFVRETHSVVNNMTNNIPNQDTVITCENHICGFDIKYITSDGTSVVESWIPHDHILPIHATASDQKPYVHYIMDNPQTIRFMYQLSGNRYWIPQQNSKFEITIYTCHGQAANFTAFKQDEQPTIVSESTRYSNNGNITKAAFIISGSTGGMDIGNVETVRRQTIEAYNTANVISTDHDIQEWFKTFFFRNVLYPFFYKRRDDPWGRVWAGFMALKDDNNEVFRTNTLHAKIPYRVLYSNNDNTVSDNEVIIPPGWLWTYTKQNRYSVKPYIKTGNIIETAKTLSTLPNDFIFANPFGIRIQKQPFSIGYFNPWLNTTTPVTHLPKMYVNETKIDDDPSLIYHATPLYVGAQRTYKDDYYNISTYINPNVTEWTDGSTLTPYVRLNAVAPTFTNDMWDYFKKPTDMYAQNIPICHLNPEAGYIPYDPENTYLCVKEKDIDTNSNKWTLKNIWVERENGEDIETILIPITGNIDKFVGSNDIWGSSKCVGVPYDDDTKITLTPAITSTEPINFNQINEEQYYAMTLNENAPMGSISKIVVSSAAETDLTKYGETILYRIGVRDTPVTINVYFNNEGTLRNIQYTIRNAAQVLIPYTPTIDPDTGNYVFSLDQVGSNGAVLYADMKPSRYSGAYDYYRVRFSDVDHNTPMFYIDNKILPIDSNNMRVVLHAYYNGGETGWVEMQPVRIDSDGSYRFETKMYTLNKLVDVDNTIKIASTTNGGGSWVATTEGTYVSVNAENPEFRISILFRSTDSKFMPGYEGSSFCDDSFIGFRIVDQYTLDDLSLLQELKEMRSVVNWGESSEPSQAQIATYDKLLDASEDSDTMLNFYDIRKYMTQRKNSQTTDLTFTELKNVCKMMVLYVYETMGYSGGLTIKDKLQFILNLSLGIGNIESENDTQIFDVYRNLTGTEDDVDWSTLCNAYSEETYIEAVDETFDGTNVNGGLEIQLSPFVAADLMISDKFATFVSAFANVHKSIEPVIFSRLEGNNYLDCKLIATYGLPHSYTSDLDKDLPDSFWPDLSVQIEFDVKLYNNAIGMNTINELKLVIKDYFNRLTSIHTPVDVISMDNNIYISNLIKQMKENENVAYLKFKGWYTNDKGHGGKYMNADYQAIVQKWDTLEDMPTDELTRFVPEMFVLDDENIVLNVI